MRTAIIRCPHFLLVKMQQTAKKTEFPDIPDFQVQGKIGEGGIAEIFKARQVSLDRDVAIKMLFSNLTTDPDIVRRFNLESKTIAKLNHPNIVHVIGRGQKEGRYYFIMEYVDGTSFKDIIYSSKFNVKQKLEIIVSVLKALDYAHKNGVIHRDIKPANILVDKQGNALVADFGIAHIVNKGDQEVTSSDVIMGTMAYMSPEQKVSSAHVDATTDIYAVGIMLYEILMGKRPMGCFKLPSQIDPKIPKRFDEIISKCLSQDPASRYQNTVDLKNDLLNMISGKQTAHSNTSSAAGVDSFIGKCQYLDTLKETKYSTTMLVENKESQELFVIKKNSKSGQGLKEAKLLGNLNHENIIKIYGAGGDNRKMVTVMEYASGGSLADRMVQPYEFKKAMEIVIAVADALEVALKNGIIHGNLRPSNILFNKDNAVKVTDFGLPPHYNLMEKNWYAAPEKRVSMQGDVYGLGVILYQLLFGKNPVYDRSSNLHVDKSVAGIPMGFDTILSKMLAIRVAKRYRNIEEFLEDWDELQKNMIDSKKRHQPIRTKKKSSGEKKAAVIIAVIGILITLLILLYRAGVF